MATWVRPAVAEYVEIETPSVKASLSFEGPRPPSGRNESGEPYMTPPILPLILLYSYPVDNMAGSWRTLLVVGTPASSVTTTLLPVRVQTEMRSPGLSGELKAEVDGSPRGGGTFWVFHPLGQTVPLLYWYARCQVGLEHVASTLIGTDSTKMDRKMTRR